MYAQHYIENILRCNVQKSLHKKNQESELSVIGCKGLCYHLKQQACNETETREQNSSAGLYRHRAARGRARRRGRRVSGGGSRRAGRGARCGGVRGGSVAHGSSLEGSEGLRG